MLEVEKTKNFWSHHIGGQVYRRFAHKYFQAMYVAVGDEALKRKCITVLDIACGPGDFLVHLSKKYPMMKLYGSDIAPGMVSYAKKQLEGKATIVEATAQDQPFNKNSFDLITTTMAFHNFAEKEKILRGIKKLLKPNGMLVIADVVAPSILIKKFWNKFESIINLRGYVDHYTKADLKMLADKSGFKFSARHVPGMPKRYLICILEIRDD